VTRALIKSPRTCSRVRARCRAASTNSDGTTTAVSCPAIARRASNSASLRSFLTRSPDGRAVLLGAITSISTPAARAAR
jgi:hypothetical protein